MAIELRNQVAAADDLSQVLAFARQLPNRPSQLLLSESLVIEPANTSIGSAVSHARVTAFDALVKLVLAQAERDHNDLQAADVDLHAIQTGIPGELIPSDLLLLRARPQA